MTDRPHVLVLNPNTSDSVTQRLSDTLSHALPEVHIHARTAPFGAHYIADERSFCIAGHAVIKAFERAMGDAPAAGYSAVLIGCFGDPGLHALRESTQVPVLGLAESAVREMGAQGFARMAIVTGGKPWQTMLQRWCRSEGHDRTDAPLGITQVHALPATGLQMMQSPQDTAMALAHACRNAMQHASTQAVLLGGAGLAGMGAEVRLLTGLPVWDCVELVAQRLQQMLALPQQAESS